MFRIQKQNKGGEKVFKRILMAIGITVGLGFLMSCLLSLFFFGFYLAERGGNPEVGWSLVGLFFFVSIVIIIGIIAINLSEE